MLADQHGNVIVVGTRDCSLQRRNQKLVEEAPAPFLTDEQRAAIHESAKAICREADYHGAGTVEYLVGNDGVISFLEVNTRLQVEHPVTEETSGIDLVREQFRIAEGEKLRFDDDPTPRGHAFEFRINGEDPGRNFLPAPGTVTDLPRAGRPGRARRLRASRANSVIGGAFDSLLAKLIVTGETRDEALERARRALDEFVVDGHGDGAAVPPGGRARPGVPPADEPFTDLHPLDRDRVRQPDPAVRRRRRRRRDAGAARDGRRRGRRQAARGVAAGRLRRGGGGGGGASKAAPKRSAGARSRRRRVGRLAHRADAGHDRQGRGRRRRHGRGRRPIVVLEAMKMEQPLTAHKAGTVSGLTAEVGAVVTSGTVICEIKD